MTTATRVTVMVAPVWDRVGLELEGSSTIAELKRRALVEAGVTKSPDLFSVKFRGAPVLDENRTIEDIGVPDGASLIVLYTQRTPVR